MDRFGDESDEGDEASDGDGGGEAESNCGFQTCQLAQLPVCTGLTTQGLDSGGSCSESDDDLEHGYKYVLVVEEDEEWREPLD